VPFVESFAGGHRSERRRQVIPPPRVGAPISIVRVALGLARQARVGRRHGFQARAVPDRLECREHLHRGRLAAFDRFTQVVERHGAAAPREHLVQNRPGRHPLASVYRVGRLLLALPHALHETMQYR
jgi:hypothetical protein